MIMRFCRLYLKLPPCARVRHGDQWSRRDEENAEKRGGGGGIEREGAVPGAIVLSVSCWRARTKKTGGLWRITCLPCSL